MERLESIAGLGELGRPLYVAAGVFDGVHAGHQAVIGAAVEGARAGGGLSGVLTFDPHPIQVLAPEKAPRRILASLRHKERLLAELGVGVLVVLPFTKELARRPAGEFAEELASVPGLRMISVGEDWKFGKNRLGTVRTLEWHGRRHGVEVASASPVMLQGERVSSTRVRQALRDGNLAAAAAMLGRPYTVLGVVSEGDRLGSKLGAPTANIKAGDEQLPPDGVYAAALLTGGEWRPGVANLGVRPTVHGRERLLEVHVFYFEGDLYGREVEVRFGRRLRAERKFRDLEALRAQIRDDIEAGKLLFEQGTALEV